MVGALAQEVSASAPPIEEGGRDGRMSPASAFKAALGPTGFDAAIFAPPDAPDRPFREGCADRNPKRRQATAARTWMRNAGVRFPRRAT